MKWIFYFVLFNVLLVSCNKNKKQAQEAVETEVQTVDFTMKSLTEKDFSLCESQKCPEITINYLQAHADASSSESINSKISDFVIASFQMDEEAATKETVEEAAKQFITLYHDDLARFPDIAGVYSARIDVKEIYRSSEIISLELSQYLYTGGAHGNGSTTFLNVDPKDGRTLSFEDIFVDGNEFEKFAEKKFREKNNIPPSESINSTGFWFEEDAFYLPKTVGFTLDSLVFIYNNYEITSYADSPVEFKVPRSEANQFLKPQYNL